MLSTKLHTLAAYPKAKVISNWIHEHDIRAVFFILPPSLDLNTIDHLWDVVEWEILNISAPETLVGISDCIWWCDHVNIDQNVKRKHLVQSLQWRLEAVLRAKRGHTLHPNKMPSEYSYTVLISRNFEGGYIFTCSNCSLMNELWTVAFFSVQSCKIFQVCLLYGSAPTESSYHEK